MINKKVAAIVNLKKFIDQWIAAMQNKGVVVVDKNALCGAYPMCIGCPVAEYTGAVSCLNTVLPELERHQKKKHKSYDVISLHEGCIECNKLFSEFLQMLQDILEDYQTGTRL